jgi:hypothetical protein
MDVVFVWTYPLAGENPKSTRIPPAVTKAWSGFALGLYSVACADSSRVLTS